MARDRYHARAASSRTTNSRSSTSAARSRVLDTADDRRPTRCDGIDGLLLTGGDDVRRRIYGEAAHPTVDRGGAGPRRVRDRAGRLAHEADLPIFAICRGIQVLNVACGGTLVQDIPSQVPARSAKHRVADASAFELAHEVWIDKDIAAGEADARAAERRRRLRGQQPASPGGEGSRRRASIVSATAPDGVIEAIEDPAAASASASSGTRRTSGGPANSGRCSRGSWRLA